MDVYMYVMLKHLLTRPLIKIELAEDVVGYTEYFTSL